MPNVPTVKFLAGLVLVGGMALVNHAQTQEASSAAIGKALAKTSTEIKWKKGYRVPGTCRPGTCRPGTCRPGTCRKVDYKSGD